MRKVHFVDRNDIQAVAIHSNPYSSVYLAYDQQPTCVVETMSEEGFSLLVSYHDPETYVESGFHEFPDVSFYEGFYTGKLRKLTSKTKEEALEFLTLRRRSFPDDPSYDGYRMNQAVIESVLRGEE